MSGTYSEYDYDLRAVDRENEAERLGPAPTDPDPTRCFCGTRWPQQWPAGDTDITCPNCGAKRKRDA